MKHTSLIVAFVVGLVCTLSCTKEVPAELSISTAELSFDKDGGSKLISFSTNKDWSASASVSWIHVTSSGTSDAKSISVTVDANTDYDDRDGSVIISAGGLTSTVLVKQSTNIGIVISQLSYELSSSAQTINIEVKANVDYKYEIDKSGGNWIFSLGTKSLSSATFSFNISENTSLEGRKSSIIFSDALHGLTQTVNINQLPRDSVKVSSISFDKTSVEIQEGGTHFISATILPENADNKAIIWTTSDSNVATVQDGLVLGVAEGAAVITGTTASGHLSASCTITVSDFLKEKPAGNQIFYQTDNGTVTYLYDSSDFDANVVSNEYSNGKGIITFDKNITRVGKQAFWSNWDLTSVIIPDGVLELGRWAFSKCYHLKRVILPDSITTFENEVFYDCNSMEVFNMPANVKNLGTYTLYHCSGLTEVVIPEGVTKLNYVFYLCTNLQKVNIPDSVQELEYAFAHCESLTEIEIPGSVQTNTFNAFTGCYKLKKVILNEGIISIGQEAFSDCVSIESITIPSTVTSIGVDAFSSCSSMTEINFNEGLKYIGAGAIAGCSSLKSVKLPNTLSSLPDYFFYDCKSLENIDLPNSIPAIGQYTFYNCNSLTDLIIPSTVSTIGEHAFTNCKCLTSISIPNNVSIIEPSTFEGCTKLNNVELPVSTTSIKEKSFSYCTSLKSISVPQNVSSIGNNAFSDCTSLIDIHVKSSTPPVLGETPFARNANDRKIYVPSSAVGDYHTAESWSEYVSVIVGE